ncbi:MAG: glycoside hydrolase family protein [Verrucomicrobiales bacterium]|nr:glycoside hydrolase family protein [Verrucomicrobiales bacterium]
MDKYVCIHGHFYQPPRENPWLEFVELQDSAAPYHDWNERITAECYGRNATARMLDGDGRIQQIVNNYSKISFNFGPTLLSWLRDQMPWVHEAIVEADKVSRNQFSGHGSALAQVYNHMILPLANARDKFTQVLWGIRDFEFRFGRRPEGMWLSETAADTESLDTLARQGIKFTILSPYQASRVREIGKRNWKDVNGGRIDPTRPYLVNLPGGRSISVFFYDGPVSRDVAFERLLDSGEKFAGRLLGIFNDSRKGNQLAHMATDGESYGHHHRRGEMALAYALHHIETNQLAKLTIYGEYLEKNVPTHEIQIHERSAWSCSHGVGRWAHDCGCNSGGRPGWNQEWRGPLRASLDWLRDSLVPLYETRGRELLRDPWEARNDYISVILDRHQENREAFFARHAIRALSDAEKITVVKLMELQRHAMLMYTSCGWFFDELSGIETVQVIQYAGRAIQLARDVFGQDLEEGFLNCLEKARSNIPEFKDGRVIYNKCVKPAIIDWDKAAAHYAVSSVFETYEPRARIFSFSFEEKERKVFYSGRAKLVMGTTTMLSEITAESESLSYAALYLGEHNMTAGIKKFPNPDAYDAMVSDLQTPFEHADFPESIRRMDRHFGEFSYSLKSLFKDEQRRVLRDVLSATRDDLEHRFRLINERYNPLMVFLRDLNAPLPPALRTASDFVLSADIRAELNSKEPNVDHLRWLLEEAKSKSPEIFDDDLSFTIKNRLEFWVFQLAGNAEDISMLSNLARIAELVTALPVELNFWQVRNLYWQMLQTTYPAFENRANSEAEAAREWIEHFLKLGKCLGFALPSHHE